MTTSARRWRTAIFGTALFAVSISATTEYWAASKLNEIVSAFRDGEVAFALATGDMREEVLQLRRFEKDVFLNVGSPELVQSYQAKWDDAFLHFRYDLVRARRSVPEDLNPQLQEVVDSVSAYRSAFIQMCDRIRSGALSTAQQANTEANRFREAARNAERALYSIEERAPGRARTVETALTAQRCALAMSLVLLLVLLAGICVIGIPSRNQRENVTEASSH